MIDSMLKTLFFLAFSNILKLLKALRSLHFFLYILVFLGTGVIVSSAQNVKREIRYDITTSDKGKFGTINCRIGNTIRIIGSNAYLTFRYISCGTSGPDQGNPNQGLVFKLSGKRESEKYSCSSNSTGTKTSCTNGERYVSKNSGVTLDDELRSYNVVRSYKAKNTEKGFNYSATTNYVYSSRNKTKLINQLSIAIDGSSCRITKFSQRSSGKSQYGTYNTNPRLTSQKCKVIR